MRDIQTLFREAYAMQFAGADAAREWWDALTNDEREALNDHMRATIQAAIDAFQGIAETFQPVVEAFIKMGELISRGIARGMEQRLMTSRRFMRMRKMARYRKWAEV